MNSLPIVLLSVLAAYAGADDVAHGGAIVGGYGHGDLGHVDIGHGDIGHGDGLGGGFGLGLGGGLGAGLGVGAGLSIGGGVSHGQGGNIVHSLPLVIPQPYALHTPVNKVIVKPYVVPHHVTVLKKVRVPVYISKKVAVPNEKKVGVPVYGHGGHH